MESRDIGRTGSPVDAVGMARTVRRVHMVGIAGAGMSGIAEVLVNRGFAVTGSDLRRNETTARLESLGVSIRQGHLASAVEGADVVVLSSAVPPENPELRAAREQRIQVVRRAEMLAELMREKLGVAVAGSHGKTTTTSMIASILGQGGLDPTVVVGGKLNAVGSNAQLGKGPYMVVEADESDGSFLHLSPTVAVVTNIDAEHLDHYRGGLEEVREAFRGFIERLPFYGLAVLCVDHPVVQGLLPALDRRVVTYGTSPQADLRAVNIRFVNARTHFEVVGTSGSRGEHVLEMVGAHNVSNALAALAVADELGVAADRAKAGLEAFVGVDRRFSVRGEVGEVLVIDDYGHHPVEIEATLDGARKAYPGRRVVAAFQPHRYSRTRDLLTDFGRAFHDAELVFVLPVFAAGEAAIPGAERDDVLDSIRGQGHRDARSLEGLLGAADALADVLRAGDVFIAFGAGDIGRLGQDLVAALEQRN